MVLSPEKIIETICPALAGSPSLQVYLGMAVQVTDRGFFGVSYNQAVALGAAHLFTLFDEESGTGGTLAELGGGAPVSSVSEGAVSVSFAQTSSTSDSDLATTKYGKMLLRLKKARPRMGVNAGGFLR